MVSRRLCLRYGAQSGRREWGAMIPHTIHVMKNAVKTTMDRRAGQHVEQVPVVLHTIRTTSSTGMTILASHYCSNLLLLVAVVVL